MTPSSPVRRRHVFYVSGFDPNGPARYHKLYSDGARQWASETGGAAEVGARTRIDPRTMGWRVHSRLPDGAEVDTGYVFPRWDDIVRDHWWQDQWPQLADLFRTSWLYLRTGALWKVGRQSGTAFVSVSALFWLLMLALPGAAACGWAGIALLQAWRHDAPLAWPLAAAGLLGVAALVWAYWTRRHWHAQWILRSYAFLGRLSQGRVPALEPRLDAMAADLCRQARLGTDDEILVVGHSLGTIMAVSVLARAFRQDPQLARHGPAIGLLTLGHCTPLLSNLPGAQRFRDELAVLAGAPELCWVDFSDPLDHYSFAGVDPLRAAGIEAPRDGHPQVRTPGFAGLFTPGPGSLPRMNMHEIHQQYLRPGRAGAGGGYDFFAITAGDRRLAARFPAPAGRGWTLGRAGAAADGGAPGGARRGVAAQSGRLTPTGRD